MRILISHLRLAEMRGDSSTANVTDCSQSGDMCVKGDVSGPEALQSV